MEQVTEYSYDTTIKAESGQAHVWAPAAQPLRKPESNPSGFIEYVPLQGIQQPLGTVHACKSSQRILQQAGDRLSRANRDLGETAAFLAASLTTVTAIEAVINIATEKIGIPKEILQIAFKDLAVLFLGILVWGVVRAHNAIQRRARAEQDIDQAKRGIFEFCPTEQWPKLDG